MKPIPHNVEAEAAVLAGVMLRNDVLADICAVLTVDDFWAPAHKATFGAMLRLADAKTAIDPVTLEHQLRASDELGLVGGLEGIGKLCDRYAASMHVEAHAKIVAAIARRRRLVTAASLVVDRGTGAVDDEDEFLDTSERDLLAAAERKIQGGARPTKEIVSEWFEAMHEQAKRKNPVIGIPTSLTEFDNLVGGLQGDNLVVIAGRPGHGKTAISGCFVNAASMPAYVDAEIFPSLVFSLEMSARSVTGRLITTDARVDSKKIKAGRMIEDEYKRLVASASRVHNAPIMIDANGGITIEEICASARRWRRSKACAKARLGLVVIDYLQLVNTNVKFTVREQQIAYIARRAKLLSKEIGWPVLLLSQLNRNVDSRADHRPQPSDLRESGAIEQDADIIAFTYREAMYLPEGSAERAQAEHDAELIVAKNRDGDTGIIHLEWTGGCTRFDNPTRHH